MSGTYRVEPPDLKTCKSFEIFQKELEIWELTTPVPEEKRGAIIAAGLPNDSKLKRDLRDKFFENVVISELAKKEGLKLVKDFLEKELGEGDLERKVRTWDEFEDCVRKNMNIEDFASDFDRQYQKAASASKIKIPSEVRAFMVLKRSNVTRVQRMLILSKLDKVDRDNMFENMVSELKLVLGGGPGHVKDELSGAIKYEEKDIPSEEVLLSYGYVKRGAGGFRGGRGGWRGRGGGFGGGGRHDKKPYDKDSSKRPNRLGEDGEPQSCHNCKSIYHFLSGCPDKNENKPKEVMKVILYAKEEEELSLFTREAKNCAALDTCCTSNVSGRQWLEAYIDSLDEERRKEVRGPLPSDRVFKFGNDGLLCSEGKYFLPAEVAGKEVDIEADVVSSDIPLLLSKKSMKRAGMKLDMEDDTAIVYGKKVNLVTTTSGHYCLPLLPTTTERQDRINEIFAVNLLTISEGDQFKQMVKLHKQFGHQIKEKFITFMKDAGVWHAGLEKHLDKILNGCVGCIKKKRNPDKPVVCLPMAKKFNEKVCIDLKKWKHRHILHMVDMWSRLTISVFIERKKPREVIDKIMSSWIGYFGVMKAILSDNGGEFCNEELKEVKSILNIEDLTTGAESPWQNGLCEKNHATIDVMLERMIEDYPDTPEDILLGWANMAKNSMKMVYGFSSNQLVFGSNPNLPNIASDGPPAMEGKTCSEIFAHHLNALHASRKAFIETESSEKIRKALARKVCTNNAVLERGDRVYYKRERDDSWRGPAKVMFQDRKVIFVRHGSSCVRVSANRIIKQGEEYGTDLSLEDQSVSVPSSHSVSTSAYDQESSISSLREEGSVSRSRQEESVSSSRQEESVSKVISAEEISSKETSEDEDVNLDAEEEETTLDDNAPQAQDYNAVQHEDEENDSDENALQIVENGNTQEEESVQDLDNMQDESMINVSNGKRKRAENANKRKTRPRMIYPSSKGRKVSLKKNDVIDVQLDDEETWTRAIITDREKITGKYYNYYNIRGLDGEERNVDLERLRFKQVQEEEVHMVIIPREKHKDVDCLKAKKAELEKLESFKAFKEVDDVGQYRISSTWVLSMKGEEIRARLCARGFEEIGDIPSDSPTVDKPNIRLLLLIAASHGWTIKLCDVKSAFLQGRKLERKVILTPPREAGVQRGKLWELQVALYGLDDASLQFYLKCKEILESLGCQQSTYDPAFFFKFDEAGELEGCIALHVDDFLLTGNIKFDIVPRKLAAIFQMGTTEERKFTYTGFNLEEVKGGIRVDQTSFAKEKLEVFDVKPERAKNPGEELTGEEVTVIRQAAGKIGWLARGTRPDLIFSHVEMSTKFGRSKVKDLMQVSKIVRKVKDSDCFYTIRSLGPVQDWFIEVSTDASLSNLNDGVDSTGAHLILVRNKGDDCAPIIWHASKIKRIVGSTLEVETLALVEGLKEAIYLREVIEEIFGLKEQTLDIRALVDSKSTVDAVHSTTLVQDRRLRRDIAIVKQMLNKKEVTSVEWCPGTEQLADGMTKRTSPCYGLRDG